MLKTIKNAFKIKEVRDKLLFTFAMMVVIRIGSQLPLPGINMQVFTQWYQQTFQGEAFSFFTAITGGSFEKMSILALGIGPYITSSIIMQLLTIAIPALEELQKDGEDGRKKIASISRYVTVVLALIQATAMTINFSNQNALVSKGALPIVTCIVALTAGSAFLMWVGERITEKGVGNGISVVLVINIISRLPQDLTSLFKQFVFVQGKPPASAALAALVIVAIIVLMVVLVIILNAGVRKIPVQYAKKVQGRKMVGGQTSNIPLKINTSGVMPIIFASSLMQTPLVIGSFVASETNEKWAEISKYLDSGYWCNPKMPIYSIGLVAYILLTIFFAYFYTSVTFNPMMVADNMKKQGGFVPGIRPGKPTSDYLNSVLNRIVFIGVIGLIIVSVLPFFFNGIFGASVSFGGTSLIIIVSVVLETVKQVESQMLVRNYKGFLND